MTRATGEADLRAKQIESPYGPMTIVGSSEGVRAILWHDDDPTRVGLSGIPLGRGTADVVDTAAFQLEEYFDRTRRAFDLILDLRGTPFQIAAWRALSEIPYGETRTYSEQAARIGRPNAVRAIGAANGRNPISIALPCHRVVGSDGSLTGFAGGLETKAALLAFEVARVDVPTPG